MKRLRDLTKAIQASGLVDGADVDSYAIDGNPEYSGAKHGNDLLLFRHDYVGVIELNDTRGDLVDVLALVLVWLMDNIPDDEWESNKLIGWEGEPVDDQSSDLIIRLEFSELVKYTPAAPEYTGLDQITVNGAQWKRGELPADRATSLKEPVEGSTA